ncbi:MAG: hypothetical protein ACTSX2_02940 [Candidatus Thorarchaeota archaeon]
MKKIIVLLTLVAVFCMIPPVSADTTLTPGTTILSKVMYGYTSENYTDHYYTANLTSGYWKVVVTVHGTAIVPYVKVSTIETFTNNIAQGSSYSGNISLLFTLSSTQLVYIKISNMVDHNTTGQYFIGVFKQAQPPAQTETTVWEFIPPSGVYHENPVMPNLTADWIFAGGAIGISVVVLLLFSSLSPVTRSPKLPDHQLVEPPSPGSHGKWTTQVYSGRVLRLPLKCPWCGADLDPKEIEWVAPLEARCAYCGGLFHATWEKT